MSIFYRTVSKRKFKCSSLYTCNMLDACNPKHIYDHVGFKIRNYFF